jgi:hypothetical protein
VSSADRWRVLAKLRPLGGATGFWQPIRGRSMPGACTGQPCGVCLGGGGVVGGVRGTLELEGGVVSSADR